VSIGDEPPGHGQADPAGAARDDDRTQPGHAL
jgi:hypothetical protein